MDSPSISYIVSTFDRPKSLRCCLASLDMQTNDDHEILVTDNAVDPGFQRLHEKICKEYNAEYFYAGQPTCYHSAELGAQMAIGQFLAFPSDDSYFVPGFAETMLKAARENDWSLAYCEMLYSPRWSGDHYRLLGVEPRLNRIDKTGFILKRDQFYGFPDKTETYCAADGLLIERLVADPNIKHGRVDSCLVVHN